MDSAGEVQPSIPLALPAEQGEVALEYGGAVHRVTLGTPHLHLPPALHDWLTEISANVREMFKYLFQVNGQYSYLKMGMGR